MVFNCYLKTVYTKNVHNISLYKRAIILADDPEGKHDAENLKSQPIPKGVTVYY